MAMEHDTPAVVPCQSASYSRGNELGSSEDSKLTRRGFDSRQLHQKRISHRWCVFMHICMASDVFFCYTVIIYDLEQKRRRQRRDGVDVGDR